LVLGVADLLAADTKDAALLMRACYRLRNRHHEPLVGVDLCGRRLRLKDRDGRTKLLCRDRANVPAPSWTRSRSIEGGDLTDSSSSLLSP
jgi:hypothetical protein